ncbi:MAG: hypothetical protein JRJ83_18225 [Deltaproteobacteria bacterium]|nr:hypothetical protein [Deltaproteobacteria bacterium]
MTDHRKTVVNLLIPHFRRDERYYLLVGDMGFGAIDRLRDEFPDRVINVGIMEQGATGIAAGMSMSGLIPIFYTIVNFLVFRALEQVRNDVVLQHLNWPRRYQNHGTYRHESVRPLCRKRPLP